MEDLIHAEKVSKNEFEKTVTNLNIDINIKTLIIMMMRESNSLTTINGSAIKILINRIKNLSKNFKTSDVQYGSNWDIDVSNLENEDEETQMRNAQLELNLNHNFFMRLAEFMFNNDLTLYQIIHPKIYDKMFNGSEYELINSKSFFKILELRGLRISSDEKRAVSNLLKSNYLLDVFEVDKVIKILEELDIREDIPNPSKNFDYKHLAAPDIRIMNRVIKYMDDHIIDDVEDFIGNGKISVVEVIGNNKTEDIHIINAQDFTDVLIEKNWLEDEEVLDGLQMFFAVSIDNIDKLMVRKIKKWVKDFRSVKFFKYYGTEFRSEESVLSDIEEDLPVVNRQTDY